MKESLIKLFQRDLEKVKVELLAYSNEATIWKIDKSITNSAGNLALHLIGNLNHFIGAGLGETGYVRQRELEFSSKNISVNHICNRIDEVIGTVTNALSKLTSESLKKEFTLNPLKEPVSTELFLLHLKSHLAYHLGQINYHRRLLD